MNIFSTSFFIIIIYLFSAVICALQTMPSQIHDPTRFIEYLPVKDFERIDNNTFTSSVPIINYEINSRMYYKKG